MEEEKILECIRLYESGKTIMEVSNIMNIKYRVLYRNIRNRIIIKKSTNKDILSVEQEKECVRLFNEGKTTKEISKILDKYLKIIKRAVQKLISMKNKTRYKDLPKEKIDIIVKMYENEKTIVEISEELQISNPIVWKCIKENTIIRKQGTRNTINDEKLEKWVKLNLQKNCIGIGNPTVSLSNNCKMYYLTFGGKDQTVKILKWLYKDTEENIYLGRKHEIYLKYLESYSNMELKQ
jgi:DNA-binding CsgD family transcriptional regulator